MKTIIKIVFLIPITILITGCATPYMMDRERDAADIFTFTLGKGYGVTTRIGPLHTGVFWGIDCWGLKGGEFQWNFEDNINIDHHWGFTFDPLLGVYNCDIIWGFDDFENKGEYLNDRKQWRAEGVCPFVLIPKSRFRNSYPSYFFSQIEISGGFYRSLRLGINPGELIDFLFGWEGIDIYDDDIEQKKQKEKSTD